MAPSEQADNISPAGVARLSTARSWLSQRSIDDSRTHALKAALSISVPLLAIERTADSAAPQPPTQMFYDVVGAQDKSINVHIGANQIYDARPEFMAEAVRLTHDWSGESKLPG